MWGRPYDIDHQEETSRATCVTRRPIYAATNTRLNFTVPTEELKFSHDLEQTTETNTWLKTLLLVSSQPSSLLHK